MTLYLKYRPQLVDELDETEVRETLRRVLGSKNIPHAWIFSGPRGTGKTSSARILAKAINCTKSGRVGEQESRSSIEPCNECEMCVEIMAGNAPDVIEIDAASNRGIEEIRELREKVRLAPMKAEYKVYIIDEVHMLTTEAANALLKTLEEPPESTIFILCTTDPEKLPETVISRCTRIMYKKPSLEEGLRSLERVTKGEGVKAEKKALELIAKAARGSFRDGTKIVEQVLLSYKEISEEAVREITGQLSSADPEEFIKLWNEGRQKGALEYIDRLVNEGVNLRSWIEGTVEVLRQELLNSKSPDFAKASTGKQMIIEKIRSLDRVYEQMKTAAVVQLPLEIMVLEEVESDTNIGEPPRVKVKEVPPKLDTKQVEVKIPGEKAEPKREPKPGEYSLDDINLKWQEILKAVKPKNHSVEGLLRSTKAVDFDGEKLTLEVFYKFHKDKLETDKCRTIVEESVGEVFEMKPIKLFLKLGQKTPKAENNLSGQVGEDILSAAAEIFKADVV